MKNLNKVLVATLAIFLLTGCGSKNANEEVTCQYSQEESMVTVNQDLTLDIKDGSVKTAKLVNELVYADEYIGQYDEDLLVTTLEDEFSSYKKVEVVPTSTGAVVTIELDTEELATLSGVSTDDLKNLKETDIPDLKTGLESSGYKCK